MEYKYRLEKYSGRKSRFICPRCTDKDKTFTKYINTRTNQYISDEVGKCSREIKCGYHCSPSQYFSQIGLASVGYDSRKPWKKESKVRHSSFSVISSKMFTDSLVKGKVNYFLDFLKGRFGIEKVNQAIDKYHIGTSKKWKGSTVFWQVDFEGRVRTGKIMLYDEKTGKRVKNNGAKVSWVHSELRLKDFELRQCFFGEHLLTDEKKVVAIVEAEKTAVMASLFWPQFIWIATGGIQNFRLENCKHLSGRDVVVFPDLGGYEKWSQKIYSFSTIANFKISSFLEQHATIAEKEKGLDLADYLLECESPMKLDEETKFDSNKGNKEPIELIRLDLPIKEVEEMDVPEVSKTESWEGSYEELYSFFSNKTFLEKEIQLDACTKISNVELFVESHLNILKLHWNNRVYKPFLWRLLLLKSNLRIG
jgi:hypothetical protein